MISLKFIFPQNYNFRSKLFGIIDYSVAIFNIIWCLSFFLAFRFIFHSIKLSLIFSIPICLPILIFSVVGFNGENISLVFKYILKYLFSTKIYVFNKHYF